ncbi:WD40-repeat-containing domain protein [Kockiozyma suomiensis]|uniref:WD40-repeat-containing domain protein n=1 Tax=Kockiozyma suomiensis TaxID=1337062 RepID=UPI00334408A9
MLSSFIFTRETGLTHPHELRSAQLWRQYSTLVRSELRYFPTRHSGTVNALAVDPIHNRFMISGGSDSRILVWDLHSREGQRHRYEIVGRVMPKTAHKYGISCASWWPFDDGMFITSSFDESVRVWDSSTLEDVYNFSIGARVNAHDVSTIAEHCLVAVAADCNPVRLVDLRSSAAAQILTGHEGTTVNAVKWSPTEPFMLASGGSDGTVRLWDIRRSNACLTVLNLENTSLTSSSSSNVRRDVFSTSSSSILSQVKSHRGVVNGLAFLADGLKLVSTGTDETIRVWSMTGASEGFSNACYRNTLVNFGPLIRNRYLQCINMVLTPVRDCAPQLLFYPNDNGDVLMFDVSTGRLVRRLSISRNMLKRTKGLTCRGSEFVEIFSGSSDGDIILWEAERSDTKRTRSMPQKRENDNILTEIYKGIEYEGN